jgi:hypothetical protein
LVTTKMTFYRSLQNFGLSFSINLKLWNSNKLFRRQLIDLFLSNEEITFSWKRIDSQLVLSFQKLKKSVISKMRHANRSYCTLGIVIRMNDYDSHWCNNNNFGGFFSGKLKQTNNKN